MKWSLAAVLLFIGFLSVQCQNSEDEGIYESEIKTQVVRQHQINSNQDQPYESYPSSSNTAGTKNNNFQQSIYQQPDYSPEPQYRDKKQSHYSQNNYQGYRVIPSKFTESSYTNSDDEPSSAYGTVEQKESETEDDAGEDRKQIYRSSRQVPSSYSSYYQNAETDPSQQNQQRLGVQPKNRPTDQQYSPNYSMNPSHVRQQQTQKHVMTSSSQRNNGQNHQYSVKPSFQQYINPSSSSYTKQPAQQFVGTSSAHSIQQSQQFVDRYPSHFMKQSSQQFMKQNNQQIADKKPSQMKQTGPSSSSPQSQQKTPPKSQRQFKPPSPSQRQFKPQPQSQRRFPPQTQSQIPSRSQLQSPAKSQKHFSPLSSSQPLHQYN